MEKELDNIYIELNVIAAQGSTDIWMQGDIEIIINGKKPYDDGDIVNSDSLIKSLESNGKYFLFSCCCGIPECSGWYNGIEVIHEDDTITWIDSDYNRTWTFDRNKIEQDLKTMNDEVKVFKKFFQEKQIQYVGYGHNF
nr:hypothetical protein [uncultured Flavobacterium sp.]